MSRRQAARESHGWQEIGNASLANESSGRKRKRAGKEEKVGFDGAQKKWEK